MANAVVATRAAPSEGAPHSLGMSILLTVPIALWSLLMFSRVLGTAGVATKVAGLLSMAFMVILFFLMIRTGQTYRWRRIFFVSLGVLFPIGFVADLIAVRGSMSIPLDRMIAGDTPFCFLAIPMMIIPAALTRTLVFPGTILPTASNPHSVAMMVALWLAATIVLGKAWCSFGCFFGGIEEGFAAIAKRARIRNIHPRWRLVPWAVLGTVVLLAAATFEPIYCSWLCPFKAVTEFAEIRTAQNVVQTILFVSLFVGLVVVLPVLTRKRTQCAFFCPFGAFQSLSNKLTVFEVRIDRDRCADCVACQRDCPTMAISKQSVQKGRVLLACMRCGACVDKCPKGAAVWHIRGTPLKASPQIARLLFLYPAWGFAVLFGGSIIAGGLSKILFFLG